MPIITYDSNNSGGSWWLTDEDWINLEKAGWKVDWERDVPDDKYGPHADGDGRWLGALATRASKEFNSVQDAEAEWSDVTGQYVEDEGCPCCGPPHYFYEERN